MFAGLETEYSNFLTEFNACASKYFTLRRQQNTAGLWEAIEYSFNSNGKRFRPFLIYLLSTTFRQNFNKVLNFALAIEFIHTYSLVHDDLPCMDNDDFRRGVPTNHKVFGEATALLVGDALLTEAIFCIASDQTMIATKQIKAIQILTNLISANGMIGGQWLDMTMIEASDSNIIDEMMLLKTANLIQAATMGGAILLGCNDTEVNSLQNFSTELGRAFQIKDDILDFHDMNQDFKNIASARGLNAAEQRLKQSSDLALLSLKDLSFDVGLLVELISFNLNRKK